MMTPQRLTMEAVSLEKYFPNRYKFENFGKPNSHLDVGVRTNSNKIYRLRIELNSFPNSCPTVFLTYPEGLRDKSGVRLNSSSHHMHTLSSSNEWTQLCYYRKEWSSNIAIFKIIMKAKIWLEAYEGHLITGNTIDHYVKGNY